MRLLEDKRFYVYIYLDPRKNGGYKYGEYEFDYKPFYVGKGSGNRKNIHLIKSRNNTEKSHFFYKIRKIRKDTGKEPIIILNKKDLKSLEALKLEIKMIKTIGRKDLKSGPLINQTDGGDGNYNQIFTTETRKKMGESRKKWKLTKESRKKMSESRKGIKLSDLTKLKISNHFKGKYKGKKYPKEFGERISERLIGRKLSKEHKMKIRESHQGLKQSEETIEKRRKSNKDKKRSEEIKRKMSEAQQKRFKNYSMPIEQRLKISDSLKGHEISEETRKKLSEKAKNRKFAKMKYRKREKCD